MVIIFDFILKLCYNIYVRKERKCARSQPVRHVTFNHGTVGSIPTGRTNRREDD